MTLRGIPGLRPLRPADFAKDEGGSLVIFTLILFVLMAMMGGIAVDLMRYEATRVTLQQTLDRATLAAASLDQTLPPDDVVADYFAKAGLSDKLDSVDVTEGVNCRSVHADAAAVSENYFMHMIDIDQIDAEAGSAAEQCVTDIEIMLVLDISGSMSGTKMTNLKNSAKEFIDTVMANDTMGRVSIGIVPYSAQVNLGPALRSKYNAVNLHGIPNVNCLELPSSVYGTVSLSRTTPLPMMAHADVSSGTSTGSTAFVSATDPTNGAPVADRSNRHCEPTTTDTVTLPTKDRTHLKNRIDALFADGNTSIMLGMRWGVALLDENARPLYSSLITSGDMSAQMAGRPFDYDNEDALKIIVLMTDGEHVAHNRVPDAYKTALSPIYLGTDSNYSIRHTGTRPTAAGTNQYFVPHLCTSTNCRAGTNTAEAWRSTPWSSGVQKTWNEVWAVTRPSWVAWQLYARALGSTSTTRTNIYNTTRDGFRNQFMSVATMNSSLSTNCAAARTAGILVYGIAFEAPPTGQAAISNCTSSPQSTFYFNATGLQIRTAFRLIAANISQLRLTQ